VRTNQRRPKPEGAAYHPANQIPCGRCGSHGFIDSDPCWECDGTGEVARCRGEYEAQVEMRRGR
jgi:DnaJ-class molecular chaperone